MFSVVLESDDFEAIRGIIVQFAEFVDDRIIQAGGNLADVSLLSRTVRQVRDAGAPPKRVRLNFDVSGSLNSKLDVTRDEVSVVLPVRITTQLPGLAEMVFKAFGPRELFLRTGFSISELRSSMAKLTEHGSIRSCVRLDIDASDGPSSKVDLTRDEDTSSDLQDER